MAEDPQGGGEKTEDASSRKLEKAREEGQVAKSIEIPSVVVVMAGALALYAFAFFIYQRLMNVMHDGLAFTGVPLVNDVEVVHLLLVCTQRLFIILAPLLAAVFVGAFASNLFQVGFVISWKAIAPKFSRIDPIKGFAQKFSSKALMEFVKSILKITIISVVTYMVVKSEIHNIVRLYDTGVAAILLYILKISLEIFIKVLLVMVVLAVMDFAFQRWKFMEDQKMTKQEVKDEHKQAEGDPQVKSRIRQLQAEAARKRMMSDVPKADVVVTNPTRLAIAVKYDGMTMEAPTVVAKGAGAVAANIRRIAMESDVPLVENKTLARNLYKMVDVGQEVPTELFQAVAELLAQVYKLKGDSR
ncbi:MAG: flagellar biosynthesis protein FlhB [Desulfobacterium sp.]|jgi:flagellar biosynthetic protein FlhB|nr:flagellar biosynthesis protein FlhB [Desulfobacterium sp.]